MPFLVINFQRIENLIEKYSLSHLKSGFAKFSSFDLCCEEGKLQFKDHHINIMMINIVFVIKKNNLMH